MTENDKKLMNGCYMAEIRTNALDAKPSTAKGFIRGYEKAFSLHVVSHRRELLFALLEWIDHGDDDNKEYIVDSFLKDINSK